jgi:ankyrin repeat protein
MLSLAESRPLPYSQMINVANSNPSRVNIPWDNLKVANSHVSLPSPTLPKSIIKDIDINFVAPHSKKNKDASDLAYQGYDTESKKIKQSKKATSAPCPCPPTKSRDSKQTIQRIKPKPALLNNLLIPGVGIDARDSNGFTGLMVIAKKQTTSDLVKDRLIKMKPNVNIFNVNGDTALHLAIKNHAFDNAKLLIDHGGNINLNIQNNKGRTPIMLASLTNDKSLIDKLIERGASLNSQDFRGRTALSMAIIHGKTENARTLIQAGACLDLPDNDGYTPRQYATKKNSPLVSLMLSTNPMFDTRTR